ncbi:hypothetical protein IGI04_008266 [Brassica rapa subsp. trilocularis]|uniref:Uncharacterized protein n=1 Tax=Brassica rapa subsp. trilocularis TaxID=1813537 RepID=A0ABQ7NM59_BRACM|nr:hypothetical protein IGI04_008266 [Brassica rapa subsp. trilocularis]
MGLSRGEELELLTRGHTLKFLSWICCTRNNVLALKSSAKEATMEWTEPESLSAKLMTESSIGLMLQAALCLHEEEEKMEDAPDVFALCLICSAHRQNVSMCFEGATWKTETEEVVTITSNSLEEHNFGKSCKEEKRKSKKMKPNCMKPLIHIQTNKPVILMKIMNTELSDPRSLLYPIWYLQLEDGDGNPISSMYLEVKVLIKEKLKLEPFWLFSPVLVDILKILETTFIWLSYLELWETKT